MQKRIYQIFNGVLFLLLLAWSGMLNASKIYLITADLGRHIKNGEIFLHSANPWALLHTNFYSYTNPDFSFINHHWASGIFFYLLYHLGGFNLLSIIFISLTILTFAVFLRVAWKQSNLVVAGLVAVLLLPIITSRKEVRPEIFTYLFCGIYYWVMLDLRFKIEDLRSSRTQADKPDSLAHQGGSARYRIQNYWRLYSLPLIMVFWVNLHIGFILGIGVIGVFWVEAGWKFWRKQENNFRILSIVLGLTIIAALLNPSTWRGLLYPLFIFRNYGYLIVENQSIFFLTRLHHDTGLYFGLFESMVVVTLASFIAIIIWKRSKFSLPNFLLFVTFSLMATKAIRDFPLFGLFALPILSANINEFLPIMPKGLYRKCVGGIAVIIILGAIMRSTQNLNDKGEVFGVGLIPGQNAATDFFKNNNLHGPIFNNYDVGGYLIYNLYPAEKVFVDNRPEAYPVSFLQNIYIPAQEDNAKWQELDNEYHFNTIFFFYGDGTPWAQTFLINRIQDPNWAPVFVDSFNIIFLKRTAENESIIQKFEVPKSRFSVSTKY